MEVLTNNGNPFEQAMKLVSQFIETDSGAYFMLIGQKEIGKYTALKELFIKKGVDFQEHQLLQDENLEALKSQVVAGTHKYFLYYDIDYSHEVFPELVKFIEELESGAFTISGKLIISIDGLELNTTLENMRGVFIPRMGFEQVLNHIERQLF